MPCRHVPELRVEGMKKALDEMIRDGIIELIDHSDYVHPMQTIAKLSPIEPMHITMDFS